MTIRDEARQEAERRWPLNHLVDDPFGETGEAWSDPYGYHETAQKAFEAGAVWASEHPDREPSDAEVEAAAEAMWDRWGSPGMFPYAPVHRRNSFRSDARAALLAAQEVRRG